MNRNTIRPAVLAIAVLASAPVMSQERVLRDILGIGGAIIINEMNQRNRAPQSKPRTVDPAVARRAAEEREQMRIIQSRLNALGYDAGTPDGVAGPRTRRAIADFQSSIGGAATGQLSAAEIATLHDQANGFAATAAPVGAFPALAAPGANVGTAPAFPALGTPTGAPAQPGSAFPALGGAAPNPAAAPASAFPALAVPGAAAPVPAFPTIAGAPVAVSAAPAEAKVALLPSNNLAAEVTKTSYAALDAQPGVLGVQLGSSEADFYSMLTDNGFEGCVAAPAAQQCVRETASLNDTVKGWVAGTEGVWAMARLIQFKEPVPAEFVRNQFAESYPELLAEPDGLVSSSPDCTIGSQSVPALAALFDSRQDPAGAVDVPPALLQLATACPVAYAVAFNEGNNLIAAVQVLLFDGTSVVRQHERATAQRQNQLGADLKF